MSVFEGYGAFKVPSKTVANDILNFFLLILFSRENVLVFHVNHLLDRHFSWVPQCRFSWRNKKTIYVGPYSSYLSYKVYNYDDAYEIIVLTM